MTILHAPSFRFNSILFLGFLSLAIFLGVSLPERYPVHFDVTGAPTRWEERGAGMWILLVAVASISFGTLHLFQRFLLTDPDTRFLNVPHKGAFLRLPRERKIPVFRRMNRMLGLLNTSLLVIFMTILLMTWWSAHQPGGWQARLANLSLWVALGFSVLYPLWELMLAHRMIRRKLIDEGLLDAPEGSGFPT